MVHRNIYNICRHRRRLQAQEGQPEEQLSLRYGRRAFAGITISTRRGSCQLQPRSCHVGVLLQLIFVGLRREGVLPCLSVKTVLRKSSMTRATVW
jgi:hypothetical protein